MTHLFWRRHQCGSDYVVDRAKTADGIKEVTEFPAHAKKGDMVLKGGEVYICTNVD